MYIYFEASSMDSFQVSVFRDAGGGPNPVQPSSSDTAVPMQHMYPAIGGGEYHTGLLKITECLFPYFWGGIAVGQD